MASARTMTNARVRASAHVGRTETLAREFTQKSSIGTPWYESLPDAAVVLGAIDVARYDVLPMTNDPAIFHRQAPVVARAHGAHFAVDTSVLPLQTRSLVHIEPATSLAINDASLLVHLALGDGVPVRGLRGGLCNRNGGRYNESRHKYVFEESHGVPPSVTAVAAFRFLPLTLAETQYSQIGCEGLW